MAISYALQVACLTQALYHEARGESIAGQEMVAQVIRNRVHSPMFPDDYCSVIKQPGQFSFNPNKGMIERGAYERAHDVAVNVMADNVRYSPVDYDVISYHTSSVNPRWNPSKLKLARKLGNHVFYKQS